MLIGLLQRFSGKNTEGIIPEREKDFKKEINLNMAVCKTFQALQDIQKIT